MLASSRRTITPFKPQLASTERGSLCYNNNTTQTRLQLVGPLLKNGQPAGFMHVTIGDHDIVFSSQKASTTTNRLFHCYGPSKFVTVHFQTRLESRKAACQYIEQVVTNGITIDGHEFHFLGHSNSQLAEKTCVLYECNDRKAADALLAQWGDFASISNPAKCAKRIGLLFSGMQPMAGLSDISHKMIPDVQAHGFNFTDGCGLMSPCLALALAVKSKLTFGSQRYIPSVVQLRYRGFKGVVQLQPGLQEPFDLQLRPSQEKFKETLLQKQAVFGLVATSLPYKLGNLNKQCDLTSFRKRALYPTHCKQPHSRPPPSNLQFRPREPWDYACLQFIMLLSAMGISDTVFESKQAQYFAQLANMRTDPGTALKYLMTHAKVEVASLLAVSDVGVDHPEVAKQLKTLQNKLIQAGIRQPTKSTVQRFGVEEQEPNQQQSKLRIQVDQSRVVFGVADTSCSLQYGECFFQPTIDGTPCMLTDTYLLVGRNPCYHCGDLRVLKAVGCEALRHLKDCIAFPVQGPRPHADEMAGGDLDGDTFFVCWDPDLIPHQSQLHRPMSYNAAAEKPHGTVTTADRIRYFANHQPGILGKLDKRYNQWANLKGVACRECVQLADLFSVGVDSVKTGGQFPNWPVVLSTLSRDNLLIGQQQKIPEALLMGDNLAAEAEEKGRERIWNKLQLHAEQFSSAYRAPTKELLVLLSAEQALQTSSATGLATTLDEADIWALLFSQDICMSEEQLLHLVTQWCKAHASAQFLQMMMHIDFGHLNHVQRMYALQAGVPRNIVLNALNQSQLLTREDRLSFQLEAEGPSHWKLLGAAGHEHSASQDPAVHQMTVPAAQTGGAESADAVGQLQRALTQHHKKLLVFTVQPKREDPAQTVAIYIPETYPEPGRYDAGGKIVSFVFCNGLRRKQVFHKYQTLEFDPVRLQIFARQSRKKPVTLTEQRQQARDDLANSFLWLKHQENTLVLSHTEGRLRISVAVGSFDASAYRRGQLQRINKQPVSYEFYVVNSRVPVEQPRLIVPETTHQHTCLLPGSMFYGLTY
ncbi:hypothetical protein ABBQ38_003381 [Trebouxia sp. C0009 RCD-2024]